jgi:hypothetical protein
MKHISIFEKPSWLVELDESKIYYSDTFKSLWFSRNRFGICYASVAIVAVLNKIAAL